MLQEKIYSHLEDKKRVSGVKHNYTVSLQRAKYLSLLRECYRPATMNARSSNTVKSANSSVMPVSNALSLGYIFKSELFEYKLHSFKCLCVFCQQMCSILLVVQALASALDIPAAPLPLLVCVCE